MVLGGFVYFYHDKQRKGEGKREEERKRER
jgi:hypothetical protein